MGWHGDPDLLTRDAYSADFGVGFYGHWKNAGSYLACTAALGWLCIGCDLSAIRPMSAATLTNGSACTATVQLHLAPRDGFRRKLYLSPLGVLMELDGGVFEGVILVLQPGPVAAVLRIRPAMPTATHAHLTLLADGDGDAPARRVRLRCSAPCGFEASPFVGGQNIYRVRLGSAEGATLEVLGQP